jgi:hypothetical protein
MGFPHILANSSSMGLPQVMKFFMHIPAINNCYLSIYAQQLLWSHIPIKCTHPEALVPDGLSYATGSQWPQLHNRPSHFMLLSSIWICHFVSTRQTSFHLWLFYCSFVSSNSSQFPCLYRLVDSAHTTTHCLLLAHYNHCLSWTFPV